MLSVVPSLLVLSAVRTPPVPAVRHFINLSNGAEALQALHDAGVPPESISFIRLQSSHCEAQDFNGLQHSRSSHAHACIAITIFPVSRAPGILQNLDHNLLMHLALGFECRCYQPSLPHEVPTSHAVSLCASMSRLRGPALYVGSRCIMSHARHRLASFRQGLRLWLSWKLLGGA